MLSPSFRYRQTTGNSDKDRDSSINTFTGTAFSSNPLPFSSDNLNPHLVSIPVFPFSHNKSPTKPRLNYSSFS